MTRNGVVREGVLAGLLGAAGVALWFFVVDLLAGEPFYTPNTLGAAALSMFGDPRPTDTQALHVIVYTIFHVVAFMLVGIIAAAIVRASEREPSVLAGALILFVAIQVLFYGFTALLAQRELLGRLAWYQVWAANLVAAVLMGTYLWRAHPALGRGLSQALAGGERNA